MWLLTHSLQSVQLFHFSRSSGEIGMKRKSRDCQSVCSVSWLHPIFHYLRQ